MTIASKIRAALADDGAPMSLAVLAKAAACTKSQVAGWLSYAVHKTGEIRTQPGDDGLLYSLNPKYTPKRKRAESPPPTRGSAGKRLTISPPAPAGNGHDRPAFNPLALPPADELRCAMFHDGTIVIDKAGVAMTLEPHECARLDTFLDQMEAIWQEAAKKRGAGRSVSHAKSAVLPAPGNVNLVALAAIDARPQIRTRFDKDGLAELAESIRANGVLQPVLLRPGKKAGRYELIAGERRVRASGLAGLTHVPALIGPADEPARLRMQLAENLDREELDEREVCKAVKALFDREKDLGKVAAIVRRSKPWVSKHLAPEMSWTYETQALFEEGASEDLELLGAFDQLAKLSRRDGSQPAVTREALEKTKKAIVKGKITRDELRAQVAEAKAAKKEKNEKAKAREQKRIKAAKERTAKLAARQEIVEDLMELLCKLEAQAAEAEDVALDEVSCIGCRCNGCDPGCHWIREDLDAGAGLCSECEHLKADFDAGRRLEENWTAFPGDKPSPEVDAGWDVFDLEGHYLSSITTHPELGSQVNLVSHPKPLPIVAIDGLNKRVRVDGRL